MPPFPLFVVRMFYNVHLMYVNVTLFNIKLPFLKLLKPKCYISAPITNICFFFYSKVYTDQHLIFLSKMVKEAVSAAMACGDGSPVARKKLKPGQAGNEDSEHVSIKARLDNLVREATHAIRPSSDGLNRFMYWDSVDPAACCRMLILRYEDKFTKEIEDAGGVTQLAERHEKIKKTANNEKSIQSAYLRALFLSRKNPETQLVARIQPNEYKINVESDQPRLTSDVRDSGIEEIGQLRQLLYSNKLYANKTVYAKWTEGLESGKLRSTKFVEPRPISKTITIAHEAHFRLDLYLTLQKRGYRHAPGHIEAKSRKKMWLKLLKLVDEDRKANADAAHDQRMNDIYPDGIPDAEEDAMESEEDFDADKYLG